ncbi:hypothetical protein DFH09DRAFT_1086510 [Mycena vulgaris]|nr:hypothetical protein DFH09DRAFT_1086510 [Mycena vulgaris]
MPTDGLDGCSANSLLNWSMRLVRYTIAPARPSKNIIMFGITVVYSGQFGRCEGPIRSVYALAHQRGCDGLDMTQSPDLDYKNPHLDIPPGISLPAPLPAGIHLVQDQLHPQRPLPSGFHIAPTLQASSPTQSHGIPHTSVTTTRYDQDPTGLRRAHTPQAPPRHLEYHLQFGPYQIQALPMGILRDMPSEDLCPRIPPTK